MKAKSSISGSTTEYPICDIPAEYIPDYDVCCLQHGADRNIWLLRIYGKTNADLAGRVMFSRLRYGSGTASATTTTWLPFHVTWIVSGETATT